MAFVMSDNGRAAKATFGHKFVEDAIDGRSNDLFEAKIARHRAQDYDAGMSKGLDRASEKARTSLRAFCHEDAEELLQRTQRLVRDNPKLAKVLQSHGLGGRLDMVEAIAHHVRRTAYGVRRADTGK